jgi:hypothetical protein
MALATLTELKAYLSITDSTKDVVLQLLLDAADATVETYCGRDFEADATDRTEIVDGKAQRSILLRKYPIVSLTKVERNAGTLDVPVWETVPASSYRVDSSVGAIDFLCATSRGLNEYRATYKGGYAAVPSDVKVAVIKIAAANYARRGADGVNSETVNGDSISFDKSAIPMDVETVLSNYRRPHV